MLSDIQKIRTGKLLKGKDIDALIERVNLLSKLRGSGGIGVSINPTGMNIYGTGLSVRDKLRRAQIAEVPGNQDYIVASLLNETTGQVVTEGIGFEIKVYADICNGERLDRASPKVSIGDILYVKQCFYDNDGTPEKRWYFVTTFQAAEEYIGPETS